MKLTAYIRGIVVQQAMRWTQIKRCSEFSARGSEYNIIIKACAFKIEFEGPIASIEDLTYLLS